MTLPEFPNTCKYPRDGWKLTPKPNYFMTEFDGGNTNERQRFTREVRTVSLTWGPLDATALTDFLNFWAELEDSGGEFTYEHPLTMSPNGSVVAYTFRRLGPYDHQNIELDLHEISMELEEVP